MLDVVCVALRAVSFVLLFQAAGAALFAVAFGRSLQGSIRAPGQAAALAAIVAVAGHYVLEPARMAGEVSGVFDASLQSMVWSSSSGTAFVLRIVGLALIVVGLGRATGWFAGIGVVGAVMAVVSFMLTGHTSTHPYRWLLAPLLLIHLLIVAFWLGALWPLYLVS